MGITEEKAPVASSDDPLGHFLYQRDQVIGCHGNWVSSILGKPVKVNLEEIIV